ncbi:MAG: glycosyltransferase family 4 protein [Kiritimatiellae bacterium]|nr:glycosyltransferase family 4 protein [Kiritimatiellia bacterium]
MRVGIYKDTLANRRGADAAVLALAAGLNERGTEAVVFEKPSLCSRVAEPWDVVIATGTNELLDLAALFPDRFPWPVVMQFHTNPKSQFKWKRFRRNRRIRAALARVRAIQVLSPAFVPQVVRYGAKVAVIGNWSAFAGQAAQAGATGKNIIYPAAWSKVKNQRLLLKAFARLTKEFPDWTLELYGAGKAPAKLPPQTKAMGYRELSAAYAQCAFVAFPSLDEGFGLVLADAARFGKPAVLVRDWIGTAATGGGLLAGASVRAYAQGLRTLMADPELTRAMGERAREFCAANYSRERILDEWLALLAEATGK